MSPIPSGAQAPPHASDGSSAEDRGLQVLGVVGAALLMLVWAVERRAGLINAWDIWAQPLLAAVLLVHVLALWRWPAKGRLVRISGGLCFNAYLVASVLLLVLRDDGRPDSYQFVSTMYWLPLSYGVCFLFLPTRWALWLAVGVFGATFGPIAIAALAGGSPRQWPGEFATLVWVLGGAQVAYIALLRTVATVRDAHRAAEQRMVLMQSLATTDVLTGLPNRRAMIDHLHAALAMAERHGQPVSVAVFDVDHFKRINDQHGHGAGDQALMAVGRILSGPLRGSDRVGRWGGEEYLLVAPGTALGPAAELADRLRRAIESHAFEHGEPVTTSVGVAEYHPGDDADALLQRADRAMYRAKSMGRNRTEREACPPGR